MEINQKTFERKDSVSLYDHMELQPGEITIFSEIEGKLKEWSVLDIGMGAGRTTSYLLPRSKKYLGLDYSRAMVEHCQNKFQLPDKFQFADARDLSKIQPNGPFDFIIFSFNGIDCVSISERKVVFSEIKRSLKANGLFCFSSHNLNFDLRNHHSIKISSSPLHTYRKFRRFFEFKLYNPDYSQKLQQERAVIRDGTGSFKLENFYSRPDAQIREIEENGFEKVRVFSHLTGKEVDLNSAKNLTDPWVYYLCQKK